MSARLHRNASRFSTTRSLAERVAEQDKRIAALAALVKRAATDSCVTTSDEPGCFYCDREEHTADCPARAALAKLEEK